MRVRIRTISKLQKRTRSFFCFHKKLNTALSFLADQVTVSYLYTYSQILPNTFIYLYCMNLLISMVIMARTSEQISRAVPMFVRVISDWYRYNDLASTLYNKTPDVCLMIVGWLLFGAIVYNEEKGIIYTTRKSIEKLLIWLTYIEV
jgi:hypothetical protein